MTGGALSGQSRFVVEKALARLRAEADIREYPVNCFLLAAEIMRAGRTRIDVEIRADLPAGVDARAEWMEEIGSFLIITRPFPGGWRKHSPDRRCNFTLAHELGHIFCGHLQIPDGAKSAAEKERDEREADEFAGRLLMPAALVLASRPGSLAALAEAFLVSEAAAARRLRALGQPDLFHTGGRVCPRCGGTRFSPGARYCRVCGLPLAEAERNGVITAEYDGFPAREDGRARACPACGSGLFSRGARYCRRCGAPAFNFCAGEDPLVRCGAVNPTDARYCEYCGGSTVYLKRGLLRDWRSARAAYIRAAETGAAEAAPPGPEKDGEEETEPPLAPAAACPACGTAGDGRDYCRKCGASLRNLCRPENPLAPRHTNPADARFCETCGAGTSFFPPAPGRI